MGDVERREALDTILLPVVKNRIRRKETVTSIVELWATPSPKGNKGTNDDDDDDSSREEKSLRKKRKFSAIKQMKKPFIFCCEMLTWGLYVLLGCIIAFIGFVVFFSVAGMVVYQPIYWYFSRGLGGGG
jgi:hypothetical protein